jgi:hypothetical protein
MQSKLTFLGLLEQIAPFWLVHGWENLTTLDFFEFCVLLKSTENFMSA